MDRGGRAHGRATHGKRLSQLFNTTHRNKGKHMSEEERAQRRERIMEEVRKRYEAQGYAFDEDDEAVVDTMMKKHEALEECKSLLRLSLGAIKGTRGSPEAYILCAAFFSAKTLKKICEGLPPAEYDKRMNDYLGTFQTTMMGQLLAETCGGGIMTMMDDPLDNNG